MAGIRCSDTRGGSENESTVPHFTNSARISGNTSRHVNVRRVRREPKSRDAWHKRVGQPVNRSLLERRARPVTC